MRDPLTIIHPSPFTQIFGPGIGSSGDLGQYNRGVKILIVDLIKTGTTEELGAVHVNSDLVTGARVKRRVGEAREGSAGDAGVEARGGGGMARAAAGELGRVAADRDPTRNPGFEAGL